MTKKTFLTFVVEHLAGVEGEVGGAELGVTAAVDVPLLISLVSFTLEAGSVDQVWVCLDTTNTLVNIKTGHSSVTAPSPQSPDTRLRMIQNNPTVAQYVTNQ